MRLHGLFVFQAIPEKTSSLQCMYNEGSVPREGDIVIVSGFIEREKSFNQIIKTA